MLQHSRDKNRDRWVSPNGELHIWKPAPHVLVTRFSGKLFDVDFSRQCMKAIDEVVQEGHKPDLFHDWEEMELYDTAARNELTEQAVRYVSEVNSFTVLLKSKLVRMGVSLASLLMGVDIKIVSTQGEFNDVLMQAVARRP